MTSAASAMAHTAGGDMHAASAAAMASAAASAGGDMRPGNMLAEEDFLIPAQADAALGFLIEMIGGPFEIVPGPDAEPKRQHGDDPRD